MGMSSMDEDALFAEWSWTKDLIKRQYEGPFGHYLGFDDVVGLTSTPEGEAYLRTVVATYGRQRVSGEAAP